MKMNEYRNCEVVIGTKLIAIFYILRKVGQIVMCLRKQLFTEHDSILYTPSMMIYLI